MKLNKIQKTFLIIGLFPLSVLSYYFYDVSINPNNYRNPDILFDYLLFYTQYVLLQTSFLIFWFKDFSKWDSIYKKIIQTYLYVFIIDYSIMIINRLIYKIFYPQVFDHPNLIERLKTLHLYEFSRPSNPYTYVICILLSIIFIHRIWKNYFRPYS